MRLKKLIKRFDFTNDVRGDVELGTDVRLDAKEHYIKLIDVDGIYPTDADLYAKTWAANPNSVKQWLGFECVVENGRDADEYITIVTGVNFRLHNATDEYWYNGSAWVVDNSNWNTEAEVANNISTFPINSKKLGVVINLYTSDEKQTPIVKAVKVLYSSDVSHQDDYLYRTIVRQLKAQVRPITDYPITLAATGDTIDLKNDYPLETPYNTIDIDSVFDHTDDSDHFVDLLQSYDDVNQVITLSSSIDAGKIVWIKFTYEPEVAVTTGLEYHEVEKVPSLILSNVNLTNTTGLSRSDSVTNKDTGEAVKVLPPDRSDMEVTLSIVTDSARDQARAADELKRFFANNPTLTSWGMDEKYRLWLVDEYDGQTGVNANGVHAGKLRFLLVGTLYYERGAVDVFAVSNFKITGNMDVTV